MMKLTKEQIEAAREWMMDCSWGDMDQEDFEDLTDEQIIRGVKKHFCGGLEAFIKSMN